MMEWMDQAILAYAEKHSSPEPAVLAELSRITHEKVHSPQMLSGHLQGRFLALLSRLLAPSLILEIGTYTGYSAICLAEGLRPGGKLITLDKDPRVTEIAKSFFEKAGIASQIEIRLGEAEHLIPGIEGAIDMVFIDADKCNYSKYFDLVIDRVCKGGLIIADNVLWSGRVTKEEKDKQTAALDAYNKKVLADKRVTTLLLPVRDGLNIAQKIV